MYSIYTIRKVNVRRLLSNIRYLVYYNSPVRQRSHHRSQHPVEDRGRRRLGHPRPDPPRHRLQEEVKHHRRQHGGVQQRGEVVVEVEHPPHGPEGDVVQAPTEQEPQPRGQGAV